MVHVGRLRPLIPDRRRLPVLGAELARGVAGFKDLVVCAEEVEVGFTPRAAFGGGVGVEEEDGVSRGGGDPGVVAEAEGGEVGGLCGWVVSVCSMDWPRGRGD